MPRAFIIIISISLLISLSVFAETNGRWWNKDEVPSLDVEKDLKPGRLGRNWYVDGTNGSDETGDGLTIKTAWKTIGKVFDYYAGRPAAGDVIKITAGLYREKLDIRSKGTAEHRILIGPYGNGEVVIDCSDKIEGWSIYKDKIYKAHCSFKPTAVILDEEPLFPEFSLEKVNQGKWYYDVKSKIIYVYITDGRSPHLHDIGIIRDDEYQNGIFLNDVKYVTIYGLTIKYAGGHGISILGDNNRIEKCNIKFNGKGGISIWSYGNTISTNNSVIKNHIYHNMLRNWPRGRYKWGLWTAGGSTGAPNTQFIGNIVHKNGGEGLLAGGGRGTLFIDNIVYDNWSVNIYIDGQADCVIERNLIFCHEPNPQDLYNNTDENPRDNKNLRRLRAEGIMTADENSPATFKNAQIVNNIIIGCRRGITHYGKANGSGLKNILVAYNTIVVPNANGIDESYIGIKIPYNNGNNDNVVFKNNTVSASSSDTYLLYIETDPLGVNDAFKGLNFEHNLWYHSSNPKPFHLGPLGIGIYNIDFQGWLKKCKNKAQCSAEIYRDPKLTDVKKYSANAVKLTPDSPAIDAGIPVEKVTVDYDNNSRLNNAPDIGALEFKL